MSERGEYRSISVSLIDGPDFQRLPERARSMFIMLKLNFGPTGIGVWYPAELTARLSAQTGASVAGIQDALMTLEKAGWIEREVNVVWIIGQLEHDPHVKLANGKHRTMVQTVTDGLPRLGIVGRFIKYYELWFRDGGEATGTPSKTLRKAMDSLYDSLSNGYRMGIEGLSKHNKEEEKEEEKESLVASGDATGAEYPPEFETLWTIYPKRHGGNSKKDAHSAWRARLRSGVPAEVLHAGVKRYAAFCEAEGKVGSRFVMMAASFFGTGDHYLESWDIAPEAVASGNGVGNGRPRVLAATEMLL